MSKKVFTAETVGNDAPTVLGGVTGAMLGRGLTAVIAKPAGTVPTDADNTKKTVVNLVMAVGGLVLYSYAGSAMEGMQGNLVKGAGIGIAVDNTVQLISGLMNKSETIKAKLATDTTANRFLRSAVGLNCPCDNPTVVRQIPMVAMNRPKRLLRMPMNNLSFDELVNMKKDLAAA